MDLKPNFDMGDLFEPAPELAIFEPLCEPRIPDFIEPPSSSDKIPCAQPPAKSKSSAVVATGNGKNHFKLSTAQDLAEMVNDAKCQRTENTNKWAFKTFKDYIVEVNEGVEYSDNPFSENPDDLTDDQILKLVPGFVASARRKDGIEYARRTVLNLATRQQQYYRGKGRMFDFESNKCNNGINKIVDAKMKQLTRDGHGIIPKKADALTREQIEKMWHDNVLGDGLALKLRHTMFLYNGILFGLRGGQEHRDLMLEQFSINDEGDRKTITYRPTVGKTCNGGLAQRDLDLTPRVHSALKCPRWIVNYYERYFASIGLQKTGPFYHRQNRKVGKNQLGKIMRVICEEAGITDQGRYTNQSGRKTCVSLMVNDKIEPDLITTRSGHRPDSKALLAYKTADKVLRNEISDAVNPPASKSARIGDKSGPCSSTSLATQAHFMVQNTQPNGTNAFANTVLGPGAEKSGFAAMFAGAPPGLFCLPMQPSILLTNELTWA